MIAPFYAFLWYFLIFAFIGWCLEVVYAAIRTRRFVNRGFNRGPVCPIYGCGVTLIYFTVGGLRARPVLLFLAAMLLTTAVELAVGFLLDKAFHHKWWDYSGKLLNVGGYICLSHSLGWGVLCTLIVEFLFPPIDRFIDWAPPLFSVIFLAAAYTLLMFDTVVSVFAAAGFTHRLVVLEKLTDGLRRSGDTLGRGLYKGTVRIVDGTEKLREEYNLFLDRATSLGRRLLDAFPTMSSGRYGEQLRTLRRHLAERRGKHALQNTFKKRTNLMTENKLSFLPIGAARYRGQAAAAVDFTLRHQLLDRETWRKFVEVFRHDSDDFDHGWRCEFYGKMMRGACLTYACCADEELYRTLEAAVRDLLTAQREDGRFSTYSKELELHGWDIWGRKYILTGLLHFYRICRDEALKEQILEALKKHADALIATVGSEEGKKEIVYASDHWLGVNSASILEAIVDLYRTTGEKRYLDFASYIVSTGGIQGEGNLIELALAGEKMPYEYPEVKAYETMSFFEGVLAYYEVTGERRYFDAAIRFFEAVAKTDVTVIGCSGCTHELFDRSAVRQIEYSDIIMQETCVTVTWMRVMAKLYLLTGEKKYVDRIETSALNALYGAVNTRMEKQYSQYLKIWLDPFPFDSYSPLYNNKRGVGVGGYKEFAFGGGYGCCACIASAGTALYPLCAAVGDGGAAIVNFFLPGEMNFKVGGEEVGLIAETSYPVAMDWEATVKVKKSVRFALKIRKPDFLCGAVVRVNGEDFSAAEEGGYLLIERDFSDGDRVSLSGAFGLETLRVGRRTAFRFGPLVLARDAEKEDGEVDLAETFSLAAEGGAPLFRFAPPQGEETLRLLVRRGDGGELLLTDYASCGKKWRGEKQRMTVWMNIEDPA